MEMAGRLWMVPGGPEMLEERIGCNSSRRNKAGDMRSGNGFKVCDVKATGEEQDSGHFTEEVEAEVPRSEDTNARCDFNPV